MPPKRGRPPGSSKRLSSNRMGNTNQRLQRDPSIDDYSDFVDVPAIENRSSPPPPQRPMISIRQLTRPSANGNPVTTANRLKPPNAPRARIIPPQPERARNDVRAKDMPVALPSPPPPPPPAPQQPLDDALVFGMDTGPEFAMPAQHPPVLTTQAPQPQQQQQQGPPALLQQREDPFLVPAPRTWMSELDEVQLDYTASSDAETTVPMVEATPMANIRRVPEPMSVHMPPVPPMPYSVPAPTPAPALGPVKTKKFEAKTWELLRNQQDSQRVQELRSHILHIPATSRLHPNCPSLRNICNYLEECPEAPIIITYEGKPVTARSTLLHHFHSQTEGKNARDCGEVIVTVVGDLVTDALEVENRAAPDSCRDMYMKLTTKHCTDPMIQYVCHLKRMNAHAPEEYEFARVRQEASNTDFFQRQTSRSPSPSHHQGVGPLETWHSRTPYVLHMSSEEWKGFLSSDFRKTYTAEVIAIEEHGLGMFPALFCTFTWDKVNEMQRKLHAEEQEWVRAENKEEEKAIWLHSISLYLQVLYSRVEMAEIVNLHWRKII